MNENKDKLLSEEKEIKDNEKLSRIIRDGWNKAGVAVDDALFHEAFIYGEESMKKALEDLPQKDFSDMFEMKIQLELQYLAQQGHFPPEQIQPKAKEIADFCLEVTKNQKSESM